MALSLAERERRYRLIRGEMAQRDLDVLLVTGSDGSNRRGNHRYLAGYGVVAPFDHYVVFPREEVEPVFFSSGSRSALTPKAQGWVNDLRLEHKPQMLVLEEVRRFKRDGGIGLVEINTVPIPMYVDLVGDFGNGAVRDATEIFKKARLIKSEEEIACIRRAAKVADDIYVHLKSIVRPGLTDWEIWGEIKRLETAAQVDYAMDLIECAEKNSVYLPVGNALPAGGRADVEITPAYEGYYAQLRGFAPVAPYTVKERNLLDAWQHGYEAAIESMRPGSRACDVYWAAFNAIRATGYEAPGRGGHSIGLDVDEFLSCDRWDETPIEAGMVIVCHIAAEAKDVYRALLGGTFLITRDGAEALNKVDLI
ncbi:MAG: aminopeptidase P family protein [Chloroflexi bacterium]|nr:aminopeptidase P family protein [Chloroflexota bacterium]